MINTDEEGLVDRITQLPAEDHGHDNDPERYLLGILANAMCHSRIHKLSVVLSDDCSYRSDYSRQKKCGIRNVLAFIRSVCDNLDETTAYRYELVPAYEEVIEEEREDLPGIFSGAWCYRLYQGKEDKLAAVVFVRYDASGNIKTILLSRNSSYLKAFAKKPGPKVEEKGFEPVDSLLRQRFG